MEVRAPGKHVGLSASVEVPVSAYRPHWTTIFAGFTETFTAIGTLCMFVLSLSLCVTCISALAPRKSYAFRVKSFVDDDESDWSPVVTATTAGQNE